MNGLALLGIVSLLYAVVVALLAFKKPEKVWKLAKIQFFVKMMGDKGTVIFFYSWAVVFALLGIWLILK
jgi:hypothetical protein